MPVHGARRESKGLDDYFLSRYSEMRRQGDGGKYGTFQQQIGFGERVPLDQLRFANTPGVVSPGDRDFAKHLSEEQLRKLITTVRTPQFTDELVGSLDMKNLERLVILEGDMQVLFAQMYGSKGDGPIRDVQKHFAHAVGDFRALLHRGTSEYELGRLRSLASDGNKIRIGECDGWAKEGRCLYGDRCLYWHVGAGGGKARDIEKRVQHQYGKYRGSDRGPGRFGRFRGDGPSPPPAPVDPRSLEARLADELPVDRHGRWTVPRGGRGGDGGRGRSSNEREDIEDHGRWAERSSSSDDMRD